MPSIDSRPQVTVLGVDQGVQHTGWCVLAVSFSEVRLLAHGTARLSSHAARMAFLATLREQHAAGCEQYAHEQRWTGARRGATERQGAITMAGQSEALGIIATLAGMAGMKRLKPVNPSSAKLALSGYGAATKDTMMASAQLRWKLAHVNEHEADAMGIALSAARAILQARALRAQQLLNPATGKPRRKAASKPRK